MRIKTKIGTLIIATAAFTMAGIATLPTAVARADSSDFYMVAGAAVNTNDETYGGIRWTTVVTEGYVPVDGALADKVSFGTFVVPTATYKAAIAEGTKIENIAGVVNVVSEMTAADALSDDVTYYSAIKYDDIIEDYMNANNLTELTEAETTALLTKAYQLELTAVSYALYDGEYYYATAEETSRSARQVANMAILMKEAMSENKLNQVKSYVETGATSFERETLDQKNEGYLDLTDLSAAEVTAQPITVSGLTAVDFSDSGNVSEVLIGAKKISGYTYADGTLSVTESSACLQAGKESWLSVFTKDGNVYSLPVIAADGVIRTVEDFNAFEVRLGDKGAKGVAGEAVDGYYVLADNLGAFTTTALQCTTNQKSFDNIADQVEAGTAVGFMGTLDGRGHSIEKITVSHKNGLFQTLWNATIKNLAIQSMASAANNKEYCAFARNVYNTKFENLYVGYTERIKADKSVYTQGFATYVRSSSFTNCVFYSNDVNMEIPTGSVISNSSSLKDTYYGTANTFSNTSIISERKAFGDSTLCGDAQNWTYSEGTAMQKFDNVNRYASLADMMYGATYSVAEDGTVTAELKSGEPTEITIGDYIVAKKYTKSETSYWRIYWNGTSILSIEIA